MHAVQTMEEKISKDPKLQAEIERIELELLQRTGY